MLSLSSLFMSLGLALFIFSFIKPGSFLWQRVLIGSEKIYEFLGAFAVIPFYIFFSIVIGLISPWLIFEKILKLEKISKKITPIWFLITLTILRIHADFPLPLLRNLDKITLRFSPKAIQFIIRAPPFGWLYELFIGSTAKEKK